MVSRYLLLVVRYLLILQQRKYNSVYIFTLIVSIPVFSFFNFSFVGLFFSPASGPLFPHFSPALRPELTFSFDASFVNFYFFPPLFFFFFFSAVLCRCQVVLFSFLIASFLLKLARRRAGPRIVCIFNFFFCFRMQLCSLLFFGTFSVDFRISTCVT